MTVDTDLSLNNRNDCEPFHTHVVDYLLHDHIFIGIKLLYIIITNGISAIRSSADELQVLLSRRRPQTCDNVISTVYFVACPFFFLPFEFDAFNYVSCLYNHIIFFRATELGVVKCPHSDPHN